MELVNATRMQAGYTIGMEPSGRELLVVAVKATFRLPRRGEDLVLHDEQVPLVMADAFTGEPGFSAPVYEADFAPRKQRCDVLLLGSAYAPGGVPSERVAVGLRVGAMSKSFVVVGDRQWDFVLGAVRATPPQAFTVKTISYDVAFGGVDRASDDPREHAAFMANPVGRGFYKHVKRSSIEGQPLPNTETVGEPVTRPGATYAPMGFGPIGRAWEPRRRHAGTYGDEWLAERFPFLPEDFDEAYYQAAPPDQQIPPPLGGREVALFNLTPDGRRAFVIPNFDASVHVFPRRGVRESYRATLDTIVLEPDQERVTMVWRVMRPLKRSLFEVEQVVIGTRSAEWWREREEVGLPIPGAEASEDGQEVQSAS